MKERPILFSDPMVRAIIEGRKTQTRRIVKPQPPTGHSFAGFTMSSTHTADEGKATWGAGDTSVFLNDAHRVRCPYGEPGDRLWVREAWAQTSVLGMPSPMTVYRAYDTATDYGGPWKPSIHMPRAASRITLEITGIRVERLENISQSDAIQEGIERMPCNCSRGQLRERCPNSEHGTHFRDYGEPGDYCCVVPSFSYMTLWQWINGPDSWAANPWVWVIEFKRVEA